MTNHNFGTNDTNILVTPFSESIPTLSSILKTGRRGDFLMLLVNYCYSCDTLHSNTQKLELATITTETPYLGTSQVLPERLVLYSSIDPSCSGTIPGLLILRNPELPSTLSTFGQGKLCSTTMKSTGLMGCTKEHF